jgi:hypothetical protein
MTDRVQIGHFDPVVLASTYLDTHVDLGNDGVGQVENQVVGELYIPCTAKRDNRNTTL